jgi:hypothetical protein
MHHQGGMSRRSHRSLRLGALALLAAMALWPRAKGSAAAVELASSSRDRGHGSAATHGVAARAETTAAKLVSPPRTAKMVSADGDESQSNN